MDDTGKILYYALIAFITINVFLSFFLWKQTKRNIYSRTLTFWLFNYVSLGMQFFYPSQSENQIILIYGLVNITTILAYAVYCELFKVKSRYPFLIAFFLGSTILTLALFYTDLSFTAKALPYAVSVSVPLLFVISGILFNKKRKTTILEKFLATIIGIWIIHSFNFAFFRMDPTTQMAGWMTTYVLFDLLGIILPSLSIEEQASTEQDRLKDLVSQKTEQLSEALQEKELLLKILVHDISNPLTVMKWYLQHATKEQKFNPKIMEKILYSQGLVEDIVKNVRLQQVTPNNKNVKKISITKSIEEVKFIFSKQLEDKKISLVIEDHTNGHDFIYADQSSFNHNVLSNFTSNAIKFSPMDSQILFSLSKDQNMLKLVIEDFGEGMPEENIQKILNAQEIISTEGTKGEKGTGLGMGIAKSVLDSMGATLHISSREKEDKGTRVILKFPASHLS